jgi:hypothetical protein
MHAKERLIVRKNVRPSRLRLGFLGCVGLLAAAVQLPGVCNTACHASAGAQGAAYQSDSWRRTAKGWEQTESWTCLISSPIGTLKPLTMNTLLERTWPAMFAAAELCLALAILHAGRATDATGQ